jgi:hypothetical protein
MTRMRNNGRVATIGGLTAVMALLTGLPTATADELADLKANQELLQRRIDQLAQAVPRGGGTTGGEVYGTAPVPGAALVGGSFPRSFLIPGTDTSIRVGGFADLTIDYWFTGGPASGAVSTTTLGATGQLTGMPLDVHGQTIPGLATPGNLVPVNIQHSRGNSVWQMSPRETRLNVETRTPTAWGEARTFVEFDFAGCSGAAGTPCNDVEHVSNNLIPRLRFAYGTLGGFLAGQANSNFSDPDANTETLDFGGDTGQAGPSRTPQVRYTIAGPWGSAWSASAELPVDDIITPAGRAEVDTSTLPSASVTPCRGVIATGLSTTAACTLATNPTTSPVPDLTFASYWAQPWGHIDFRGLVRPGLELNDGRFISQRYIGYGGGISGDVKPGWWGWNKDDITFQATAGNGIGRFLNDNTNGALATNFLASPTTLAGAAQVRTATIVGFGASGGYQHWWLPNLRSNLTGGYMYYSIPSGIIGPSQSLNQNKRLITAHANLIWSPVAFIDVGLEYMYGQRMTVANLKGNEQVLVGKWRVKF